MAVPVILALLFVLSYALTWVLSFAETAFDEVLKRDQSGRAPVFINNNRGVDRFTLQFLEQIPNGFGLWYYTDFTCQNVDLVPGTQTVGVDCSNNVFEEDNPKYIIWAVSDKGDARVT